MLALVVYRIGAHIPVPGIDPAQLAQLFKGQQGGILNLFNMFSGGALSRSDNAIPTLVRMHRRSLLGDIFMDTASSPDGASGEQDSEAKAGHALACLRASSLSTHSRRHASASDRDLIGWEPS
jgi:hypothetical protein